MFDLSSIASRLAYICSGGGQNQCSPKTAALRAAAAIVAIVILTTAAWHPPLAHADGGASARGKTSASAPDDSSATIQSHAQQILRALSDRHANNWVRYWQARAACDSAAAHNAPAAAPRARVLLTLTASLCAQLDVLLGVNPADYSPRGESRTVGLLLNEPGAALGYTLFTGYENNDVFLIDPLGRVAHTWHIGHVGASFPHAKLLDNGNLLAIRRSGIFEFDPRGNIAWQYRIRGLQHDHHDFLKMPNGNILLLVRGAKTHAQAIAAGANPELVHKKNGLSYEYLLEVRPIGASGGEVVWEWSPWDHIVQEFDPSKPNYGVIAEHPELIDLNFSLESRIKHKPVPLKVWLHINAIDYNPALDQIMLSPRHYSELWIIDHSATTQEARGHAGGNSGMGGDLLYRWGNPRAYARGTLADQRLFWQHNTHWIPTGMPGEGNILAFNNGNEFRGYKRGYSSIDEIAPPVDGYRYPRSAGSAYPPDEPEWTYAAETPADFYASLVSGAQRLPNGNTLIANGIARIIFQVTPDGKPVWKYVVPLDKLVNPLRSEPVHWTADKVYRAYLYMPDHPGLQALDLTPGAYLENTPDTYDLTFNAAIAGDFGDPLARSDFDIYLDDNNKDNRRLIYIKQPCAAEDAQQRFFLHIIPADARDIPAGRQKYGFDAHDFNIKGNDIKVSDGHCIAVRYLPDYPIERIHTGQFTDAGHLWRADINLNE